MLLDVTPARAVCEWWFVDTVASASNIQTFGAAFEVQHGSNRLVASAQTAPRPQAPAPAP
jgi:alkaline phosphatase D